MQIEIDALTTVAGVEDAMAYVMDVWKNVSDDSAEAKECTVAYMKLVAKKKALLGGAKGVTKGSEAATTKAKAIMAEVGDLKLLSVGVEALGPVVQGNKDASLKDVLFTVFGVLRAMVLQTYAFPLKDPAVKAVFTGLLDEKIVGKIEVRLTGSRGPAYQAAYAKARAQFWGKAVATEPAVTTAPAPKKKAVKKASTKPAVVVGPSTWHDVSSAEVLVPESYSDVYKGRTVHRISTRIHALMEVFMNEERERWAAQAVACSDLLLRHNYLVMLMLEGAGKLLVAPMGDASKPGMEMWLHGESVNEELVAPAAAAAGEAL